MHLRHRPGLLLQHLETRTSDAWCALLPHIQLLVQHIAEVGQQFPTYREDVQLFIAGEKQ